MSTTTRKASAIIDEDSSMTFIKPFSQEHDGMLFVIYEDAYGSLGGNLQEIKEARTLFHGTSEEFDEILKQL